MQPAPREQQQQQQEQPQQQELLTDVYSFELGALTAQQAADRAACAAYEAQRARKWAPWAERQELPTGATLKRYCRKVCVP
jgi:hypothetical protein